MAKKLNSVLGIDIGSQKIKVCEIRAQGREPVVTALGIADTPEGAVDHTGVYNSDAVGAVLKQLLSESGAATNQVVVSIAGQASVLVRTLEVPRMNPSELKDHMQWEINRNIPFPESNVVSDYKPLADEDPNSTNMDVVMAIAPQSAIDTMIGCVKKAGKTTAVIDVEPLSMARSIATSYGDTMGDQTVCMVDVGHKTTSINIYKGSKLLMPRQVPIGGEMFTKQIADTLGIPMDEAERLKREECRIPESAGQVAANPFTVPGVTDEFQPYNPFADEPAPGVEAVPTETQQFAPYNPFEEPAPSVADPTFGDEPAPSVADPTFGDAPYEAPAPEIPPAVPAPVVAPASDDTRIYNAIAPVLDEFVAEVRRSIDYFRSRGGDVDHIVLAGGGAKLVGLPGFLGSSVGIACDEYDPLRRLNVNARKVPPAFVDEHRQEFAVAVGNGLHIFFD
jgi:type IV pilus assembly protein PilM